jgi:uncharacterized protein YjbI with pentapeptide repeats
MPATPVPPAAPRLAHGREALDRDGIEQLGERPEFSDVTLEGLDLTDADLISSTWDGVTIANASLAGCSLEHAGMLDTELIRCDLANVGMHGSSITRVALRGGRALGFGFTDARMQDATLDEVQLDLASFRFTTLVSVVFRDCSMREVDLSSAKLTSVVFERCDMTGVDFSRAKFTKCQMRGCTLEGAKGMTTFAGIAMPWPDIVELAPVMAAALNLTVLDPDA